MKNCKGCEFFVETVEFTGRNGKKLWKTWQEGMNRPANGCRCLKFSFSGDKIPKGLIEKNDICEEFVDKK